MKPTSHQAGRNNPVGVNETVRREFPITDYPYQSLSLDGYRGGCTDSRKKSLRNISDDYFKTEARRGFATEAAYFGVIVATAIWPVLQSAVAMTHLVRAFAGI
jgi:hypothetical protein